MRRQAQALVLALVVAVAAAGADDPVGVLDAHVLRAADSSPAVGAVVALQGRASGSNRPVRREALAGAAGRTRFTKLPLGNYTVTVSFAGHVQGASDRGNHQIEAENAQVSTVIRLSRKPVVTGVVTDADGRPLPRAQVDLYRRSYSEWGARLQPTESVSTDDRGVYRIALDQPGVVWLKASHSEISFPFGGSERTTGVVFAPNSPDLAGAQPIPMWFDQQPAQVDVTLPWAPDVALAVSVRSGKTGDYCDNCSFELLREEAGGMLYPIMGGRVNPQRAPGAHGITSYGIPAGDYRLIIHERERGGDMRIASARLTLAEGPPQPYEITTAPMFPVAGRIVVEDASAETLAELEEAGSNAFQLHVALAGESPLGDMRNGHASVSLADPYFEIGPATPARFALEVVAGSGVCYVASVERDGRKLPDRLLDLSEGGDWTNLVVTVRFDAANFEAQLTGPREESAGYELRLTPLDPARSRSTSGYCDSGEGVCRGSGAVPGRYRAVALPAGDVDDGDFYRPAFQAALRGWTREVELRPGENSSFSLPAVPPEVLEEALAAL